VSRTTSLNHIDDLITSVAHLRAWLIKLALFHRYREQYRQFFFYVLFNDALRRVCQLPEEERRTQIGRYLLARLRSAQTLYQDFLAYLNTPHRKIDRAVYALALKDEFGAEMLDLLGKAKPFQRAEGGVRTWHSAARKTTPRRATVSVVTITKDLVASHRKQDMKRAIVSVASQDYGAENVEHVIVDGGSTDGTVGFITELSRSQKLEFFISERDTGIYNAMNKGVFYSRGDYVLFLNSDDYLAPTAISELVAAIESVDADYAFADAVKVDQRGKIVGSHYGSMNKVLFGAPYCHQTLLCARRCFDRVEYDETFSLTMWPFAFDLAAAGFKYVYVPKMLVAFTVGGLSTGTQVDLFKCEQDKFREHVIAPLLAMSPQELQFVTNAARAAKNNDGFDDLATVLEKISVDTPFHRTLRLATVGLVLERSVAAQHRKRSKMVDWVGKY
jgi:hypothetical protein